MDKAIKSGDINSLFTDKLNTPTETFFDTVIDLASYSLLWAGYIAETHPEVIKNFMLENKISET